MPGDGDLLELPHEGRELSSNKNTRTGGSAESSRDTWGMCETACGRRVVPARMILAGAAGRTNRRVAQPAVASSLLTRSASQVRGQVAHVSSGRSV